MHIQETGVGMIAFSGLEAVLESNLGLLDAIEIEPQTFWRRSGFDSYEFSREAAGYLKELDKPLLFHGVGYPVGGSRQPDDGHLRPLLGMMEELKPRWMSEHLSFNIITAGQKTETTAFLLPPLQTAEGVDHAVASIKNYQKNFSIPFAFETGVNYLARQKFDLDDGLFAAAIAEQADCRILLDLHNIMANELNGRQSVDDFIGQIPLERVIEMHLAGGFYSEGYYLDAHSGPAAEELLELAEKIVKKIPALKAIIFEMLPDYLPFVDSNGVTAQLERMHRIWEMRGRDHKKRKRTYETAKLSAEKGGPVGAAEWENTLGSMSLDKPPAVKTGLSKNLARDKGLNVIRSLSAQFRNGSLFDSMKFTCRYLGLKFGEAKTDKIFEDFWAVSAFGFHPTDNGLKFADYLLARNKFTEDLPADLVRYEKNLLLTLIDNQKRELSMAFDPAEMLSALDEFKLPENLSQGTYTITIEP